MLTSKNEGTGRTICPLTWLPHRHTPAKWSSSLRDNEPWGSQRITIWLTNLFNFKITVDDFTRSQPLTSTKSFEGIEILATGCKPHNNDDKQTIESDKILANICFPFNGFIKTLALSFIRLAIWTQMRRGMVDGWHEHRCSVFFQDDPKGAVRMKDRLQPLGNQ